MAENKTTSSTSKPDESVAAAKEAGADEVQAKFDEANKQGFFGEIADPTPRENYTLKGVGSGALTPETDPEIRLAQPQRLTY